MKYSIYTRTGDKGNTSIGGGKALPKNAERIEAFGALDGLNSWFGLVRTKNDCGEDIQEDMALIQQFLFDCSSDLSIPKGHREYKIAQDHIDWLEKKIDGYSEEPEETQYFIIPGGTELASWFHILRTTTRDAERRIVTFMEQEPEEVNPFVLKFINRLSDY
ncbi:MAG: cob(I)yrinic acid a,c-diamide adenosyltransferase, partial [Trichococcus flocculiformis]